MVRGASPNKVQVQEGPAGVHHADKVCGRLVRRAWPFFSDELFVVVSCSRSMPVPKTNCADCIQT